MNKDHVITVDSALCNSCGLCLKDCQHDAWVITGTGAEIITQDCIKCGHCAAICPQNAVSISGYDDVPEEIIRGQKPDPEAFLAMIKGRRSIRHFADQNVPTEIVEKIIEAGRYSPTGLNKQGVSYVVLRESKDEYESIAVSLWRRLRHVAGMFIKNFRKIHVDDRYCFKGAPVVIVIKSSNVSFGNLDVVDGAIAASAMELAARAYGLGALYSGAFTNAVRLSRKLRRKLSAESKGKVIATLLLGYPAVTYHRTAQR